MHEASLPINIHTILFKTVLYSMTVVHLQGPYQLCVRRMNATVSEPSSPTTTGLISVSTFTSSSSTDRGSTPDLSTPSTTDSSLTTSHVTSTPTPDGLKTWEIALIGCSICLVVAAVAIISVFLFIRKRRRPSADVE